MIRALHRCGRAKCGRPASFKVALELRTCASDKPAVAELRLFVCDRCSRDLRVRHILTEATWLELEYKFKIAKLKLPARHLTTLKLIAL